jgi:23S rRNA (adenine-N6)-dimethyltransferase
VSAPRRRERDRRRKTYGQNFLVDRSVVSRFVRGLDLVHDEVVVEVGAGSGALTIPLARAGARVVAVEADPVWVGRLRDRLATARIADRVRVVPVDFRRFSWPAQPYRVVANPPFGLTTNLLTKLLDHPGRGPVRADLIVQWEVARKRSTAPPTTLRSATWAPWWSFTMGARIDRQAFRPVPAVDAAVLTILRRDPPVLPVALAPGFREALRSAWDDSRRTLNREPPLRQPAPQARRRPPRG